MSTCQHLTQADEAYRYDPETGEETPIIAHLCTWADAHPERLLNAPRWVQEYALSGGPSFVPEKHCIGCPGFRIGDRK